MDETIKKTVAIVGCGPGSIDFLTPAASRAVAAAEVLVGAPRLLHLFPDHAGKQIVVDKHISQILQQLEPLYRNTRLAILVSGDPGLYSLARLVIQRFGKKRCTVIPGISSIQIAFARLGLSWSDAKIISLHHPDVKFEEESLICAEKIACLAGTQKAMQHIARCLESYASEKELYCCEDLGLEDERIAKVELNDLTRQSFSSRTVVLIVNKGLLA